jgi:RNA polymerase sigma-70 factor (ECF subfamily)
MDTVSRTADEWLTLRCQSGEPGAFEDLLAVMERPLLYYATKLLGNEEIALDVLQDVWVRALRGLRRLRDPASLRPWLYRLTRAAAVDRIRARQSRIRAEDTHVESFQEAAEPSFTEVDADVIHEALGQLELKHREVLVLHFLEDFAIGQIAQIVDCPEGTVKSRIYHAKKAMKEILIRGGYGTER